MFNVDKRFKRKARSTRRKNPVHKEIYCHRSQYENTAQLLTYIAEIEKDIKGKKYGLVFEEHREAIDDIKYLYITK